MAAEFEGISSLGITTQVYLTDPESAFQTVAWLNRLGHHLGLEIYPFHTPFWVSRVCETALGDKNPIPKKISPKDLKKWGQLYPNAQVTQIHLPFAYDFTGALRWVAYRGKDSPKSNRDHLGRLLFFGWAIDGHIEKIAQVVKVDNPNLVLNIHQDVVKKAASQGQLNRFTSLAKVSVEDSTNPPKVIAELVEPLKLGFTLGLDHPDHLHTTGLRVEDVLKDERVRRFTTGIHLPYPASREMLAQLASTPFRSKVRAYLDFHPTTLAGMRGDQEWDFWLRLLNLIKSTQPQLTSRPRYLQSVC